MQRMLTTVFVALLSCAAGAPGLGADLPRPTRIALKSEELPLDAYTSATAGTYVRSLPAKDTPKGFDTAWELKTKTARFRILHRGWSATEAALFLETAPGRTAPIPRMKKGLHAVYLPFGPLRLKGLPLLTIHFYFPTSGVEAFKARTKSLHFVPLSVLCGKLRIGSKTHDVALLDRTMEGNFVDPCTTSSRDGDWLLFDQNNDGKFRVQVGGTESKPLTKYVLIDEVYWQPTLRGRTLYMKPVALKMSKIHFPDLGEGTRITAWSCAAGDLSGELDKNERLEIPCQRAQLYTYSLVKDDYRAVGALRGLGLFEPPARGEKTFTLGPPFEARITQTPSGEGTKISLKVVGRGGMSFSLYKANKRVQPFFVFCDGSGKELKREQGKFG